MGFSRQEYWSGMALPSPNGFPSTFKVRRGSHEEIPLIQGKEQWLRFAGVTVKRYPTSKVRETQVRRWMLQEGIRGQTHWNHNNRKLVNLITQTTALSNSVKLSHALWGHPRRAGHGGQTGVGKSKCQHSRNQQTKVDWNQMTIISTTVGRNPLEEME